MRGLARLKRCQPGVHFPRAKGLPEEREAVRRPVEGQWLLEGVGGDATVSERVGEHGWWIFL